MSEPENTCGECKHWHELPRDPGNLAAPRIGQCRAVPPTPVIVGAVQTVRGDALRIEALYPQTLANAPDCGMFQKRVALTTTS